MTHCSRCNILDSTHLKPLSLLLSMLLHVRNQKEKFYYIPSPVKTQLYAFSRSPSKAGNPSSLQVGLTSFTYFHFNGLQILHKEQNTPLLLHEHRHICLYVSTHRVCECVHMCAWKMERQHVWRMAPLSQPHRQVCENFPTVFF